MIQYLFSMTIIWGISLLVYELLLKMETFHRWNRAYLLLTLLAGLLIPLIPSPAESARDMETTGMAAPTRQLVYIKYSLATQVQQQVKTTTLPVVNWWLMAYICGVTGAACFLLRDAMLFVRMYVRGKKTKQGKYTIIETPEASGPFSFFRLIFIDNKEQYTAAELAMILQHEYRHARLRHSLDIVLISVLQIVLWFHPFLFWFRKRLRLVHEYEADHIARDNYTAYGTFLIEQQLLHSTPVFTHSFYYSPIKNRIKMLTRKGSPKWLLAKYLLVAPLATAFVIGCSRPGNVTIPAPSNDTAAAIQSVISTALNNSHMDTVTVSKIMFQGNEFEMTGNQDQQIQFQDPSTGKMENMNFTVLPYPVKMNGEKIYTEHIVSPRSKVGDIYQFMLANARKEFESLEDGKYHFGIGNIIIDKSGRLVYHNEVELMNNENMITVKEEHNSATVVNGPDAFKKAYFNNTTAQKAVSMAAAKVLESIPFEPGTLNNKPVIAEYSNEGVIVTVKNHQVTLGK